MDKIVILGAGGHGKVVLEILRLRADREVVGFLDPDPARQGGSILGLPVLGGDEMLEELRRTGIRWAVIALGDNAARRETSLRAREKGFDLASAIHPQAIISPSARMGPGLAVMAGVVVNAEVVVGKNVILNTACSVDHDCVIADHAHIGPGAHLGGRVRVGQGALVGIGASALPGSSVGDWAVVGAGAVVTRAIPARSVVFGVPAKERESA